MAPGSAGATGLEQAAAEARQTARPKLGGFWGSVQNTYYDLRTDGEAIDRHRLWVHSTAEPGASAGVSGTREGSIRCAFLALFAERRF